MPLISQNEMQYNTMHDGMESQLTQEFATMNSREIVFANLDHQQPSRIAFSFGGDRLNDFVGTGLSPSRIYQQKRWTEDCFEYYDDEWGNVWRRMIDGCAGGEVHHPAIKDWSALDTLRIPDWDAPYRYEEMRKSFAGVTDKFKLVGLPGWIFATSRYLRKMEIYFMDLIEYPEEIERLHAKVADVLEKVILNVAAAGADGFIYCEDLGVQDRTLLSPWMWRDMYAKHYRRLTGVAKDKGLRVFMHSCGYNWDLIDDLVDAGIDCFQFDQPANYDMPALAAKFKKRKVALYSPTDIQKVLPTGDEIFIRAESRRMVETFKGSLIVKSYGDLKGIGVKPEWDQWAYDEFLRYA